MLNETNSISVWVSNLKEGDREAAEQLWARYFDKLVVAARRKLTSVPKRSYDEEDVAISVFKSLCRGAKRGNFEKLSDRDDLWALLLALTRQKSVDHIRAATRQKRGGGQVRGESVFGRADDDAALGFEQLVAKEPTPDLLVELAEQHKRLLDLLGDDMMRQVALMRMEGHSVKEIATHFGYTTRWAERKLDLIRKKWGRALDST
ncbi:MAG: RNA polymerase subunit sigma-70 [Planctomycetaceae bacterium]|nr:hypothetical protein [Planctomycetales bacterium]MCB9925440.1 RNA polymerase subunit sigma-70 [Planctomycetaceae bacterium]